MIERVIRIAAEGHRVFPCAESKRPLVDAWPDVATTDPDVIADWWTRYPAALVGHPTGMRGPLATCSTEPSSYDPGPYVPGPGRRWCEVVIDVDVKDGARGRESLAELERVVGPLPPTPTVRTRSGGEHRYYWTAAKIRNGASRIGERRAPGVDVRGDGGFVIVPPSTGYEWTTSSWLEGGADLAELPDSWVAAMLRREARQVYERAARVTPPGDMAHRIYTTIADAPRGSRNDTLNRYAFVAGLMVRDRRLDVGEAERLVRAACDRWPAAERDVRKDEDTLSRALTEGMES